MKILCAGMNWKTPVRIRERLSLDEAASQRALDQLRTDYPNGEFAVISTCNRTELYAVANNEEETHLGLERLCDFLADFHHIPLPEFYDHLFFHEDTGVAVHLFSVASGLDSLILGEAQIAGQVKHAYQRSIDCQCVGPTLHTLFQRALSASKRVQSETTLCQGRLSIASAAVDYVRGVFESFQDKTVLVIGAGKMAELTLTHLAPLSPRRILLCNRSMERAKDLATRFAGEVIPFDSLNAALVESDIVISSTGAEEPIVRARDFHGVMSARRNRLMAVIDIAVPRDFETAIGKLDNVLLWNIDDLEKVRYQTLRSRERELDKALRIVDEEIEAFQAVLAHQQSGPLIGRLEEEYQRIMDQELNRLMGQLNGIPDDQREKIRLFAQRLKNKFLHPPKAALRAEARTSGTSYGLLDAMRKLFGLTET